MVSEYDNMVITAIRKVDINVDKDELIKALQYDRNQYIRGYEDGKNVAIDKWIKLYDWLNDMHPAIAPDLASDIWEYQIRKERIDLIDATMEYMNELDEEEHDET